MGTEISPRPVAWPCSPAPSASSGLYCLATKTFQDLARFDANPKYFKQNQTHNNYTASRDCKDFSKLLLLTTALWLFMADFHSASSSCCSCASQSARPLGNPWHRVLSRTKNHNVQRSVEREAVKKQLRGSTVAYAASSKITNALHKVKRGKIKCLRVAYAALTVGG